MSRCVFEFSKELQSEVLFTNVDFDDGALESVARDLVECGYLEPEVVYLGQHLVRDRVGVVVHCVVLYGLHLTREHPDLVAYTQMNHLAHEY